MRTSPLSWPNITDKQRQNLAGSNKRVSQCKTSVITFIFFYLKRWNEIFEAGRSVSSDTKQTLSHLTLSQYIKDLTVNVHFQSKTSPGLRGFPWSCTWAKESSRFLTSNTSPLYFVVSSQENPDCFASLHYFAVHNKTLKTNLKWNFRNEGTLQSIFPESENAGIICAVGKKASSFQ